MKNSKQYLVGGMLLLANIILIIAAIKTIKSKKI